MKSLTFADVVHQSISFSVKNEWEAVIVDLIDSEWLQRLREVSQTANTKLVYMFSEHSRFGHSLGVAYLTNMLMDRLAELFPEKVAPYRTAVSAAAILHDIGHLAPGSHTAWKTWFPEEKDSHELVGIRIIKEDPQIQTILQKYGKDTAELVVKILSESEDLPSWTWEILSGGGWNTDRGNWCIVDSILAGVSYGKYNITALIGSIVITEDNHLAVKENRLDAMMHFAVSRHAMYSQVYQHRVLLSADTLNRAVVQRARSLGRDPVFADKHMHAFISSHRPEDLPLKAIFANRESWWKYHINRWTQDEDPILADLAKRHAHRELFKTIRIREDDNLTELEQEIKQAVESAGYDPEYYMHKVGTMDVHGGDYNRSMLVLMDDGQSKPLTEADKLFRSLVSESKDANKLWFAIPEEAKKLLGRAR